ncbi:MAG: hypothetical protein V1726_04830 [Methanobacteriota archaeon]
MSKIHTLKTIGSMSSILLVFCLGASLIGTAAEPTTTTLEITSIKGGFAAATCTVKNTGNVSAINITLKISVKGGMFNRINITKICTGCSNCGPDITANTTRTESTSEAGRIFGFGSVDIAVSAEAENAVKVTKSAQGFILGFFVIIT